MSRSGLQGSQAGQAKGLGTGPRSRPRWPIFAHRPEALFRKGRAEISENYLQHSLSAFLPVQKLGRSPYNNQIITRHDSGSARLPRASETLNRVMGSH